MFHVQPVKSQVVCDQYQARWSGVEKCSVVPSGRQAGRPKAAAGRLVAAIVQQQQCSSSSVAAAVVQVVAAVQSSGSRPAWLEGLMLSPLPLDWVSSDWKVLYYCQAGRGVKCCRLQVVKGLDCRSRPLQPGCPTQVARLEGWKVQ